MSIKTHLGLGHYRLLACGKSGRTSQSARLLIGESPKEFKAAKPEARCKLCSAIFIKKRNQHRQAKGLPPTSSVE